MKSIKLLLIALSLVGCATPSRLGISYKGEPISRSIVIDQVQNPNITVSVQSLTMEDRRTDIPALNDIFLAYVHKNVVLSKLIAKYPDIKVEMNISPREEIKRTWILDILFFYPGCGALLPFTPWWGFVNLDGHLSLSHSQKLTSTFDFNTNVPFSINWYPYYTAGKKLTMKYSDAYMTLFEEVSNYDFTEFAGKVNQINSSVSGPPSDNVKAGNKNVDITIDSLALKPNMKRISICSYNLVAGSNTSAVFGILGAIHDASKNAKDMPYYQKLNNKLLKTSEVTLIKNKTFQYILSEKLNKKQSGDKISIDTLIRGNDLFACVDVSSVLGVKMGWSKKVNMTTIWVITDLSGNKFTISTYSVSKNPLGVFPNLGDSLLMPAWLDLSKENSLQFIEKFGEIKNLETNGNFTTNKKIDINNLNSPDPKTSRDQILSKDTNSSLLSQNVNNDVGQIIPVENGKTPFVLDKTLKVNSLPESIVEAVTEISGTDKKDIYEINNDIVMIENDAFIFSASILKIGPNLLIPVFSGSTRIGTMGGTFHGSFDKRGKIVGKMHIANPIKRTLNSNAVEHILSGPNGCTLKRTIGKDMILMEGTAFLINDSK